MVKRNIALEVQTIKDQIELQGLKMYWVAMQAGVHSTTLRRWLQGKIQYVHPEKVEKLSEVLMIPCRHLIREP